MRLLVISDMAVVTGFGRVGRELGRRFLAAGHDVRFVGVNFRGRAGEAGALLKRNASPEEIARFLSEFDADPLNEMLEGIPRTVPAAAGGDVMGHALAQPAVSGGIWPGWRPERILVVADPRAMAQRQMASGGAFENGVPTWNYVPIEGAGLPACWRSIWANIEPVAMSQFGQEQLETLLGRPVAEIPHAVSPEFAVVSPTRPGQHRGAQVRTKAEAKAAFDLADRLVILRTDRFVPRKNYAALFRTMAPILEEWPEAVLVIHAAPVDEGGLMAELVSRLPGAFEVDLTWRHPQVRFTGATDTFQGLSLASLNVLYNAADIYVSPTRSEGWGLCLAEAAAASVPVVTTDYGAGPETVGPGALLIPVAGYASGTDTLPWAEVDEPRFTDAVRDLIADPELRQRLGEAGRQHVAQWTWDACAEQFLRVMS